MSPSLPASNSEVATPSPTAREILYALSMSSGSTQTSVTSPTKDSPLGGAAVTVSVVGAPFLFSSLPMFGDTVTHSGASLKPAKKSSMVMASGTTVTSTLLPPAVASPSLTEMEYSPSYLPIILASIGGSKVMSSGISVATSTPASVLNSCGPAFRIWFLSSSSERDSLVLARALLDGANAAAAPRQRARITFCILWCLLRLETLQGCNNRSNA
mmetsp:Transcript_2698/g.7920  ORF Transcript_2698/g.7920 Transcript_2698/m.7920 type:complete len:214 (+) Transcript_2698:46-687(+)